MRRKTGNQAAVKVAGAQSIRRAVTILRLLAVGQNTACVSRTSWRSRA